MAKDKKATGDYDKNGDLEEAETYTVPPPGIAPASVPAGLPPESYMTAQEAHVSGGGDYAPPPDEEPAAAAATAPKAAEKKEKKGWL